MRTGRAISILATGVALLLAPAGRAAASVLGVQNVPTSVSAFGGWAVWSQGRLDAQGHVIGDRFALMSSYAGGPAVRLAVRPRPVPFDASVGPDRTGRAVVVYSRCRREFHYNGEWYRDGSAPPYESGRDCSIYAYDLASGHQHRVPGVSGPGRSAFMPSLWRTRLAFAENRRPNGPARIEVRNLGPYGRTRTVQRLGEFWLVGLALQGRRLAFVRNEERDCKTAVVREPIQLASELWLGTLGHTMRRIERGCSSARTVRLASPSFSGGRLFYVARLQEAVSLRSRSLATGATTAVPGPDCTLSLAAGDALYLSQMTSCPSPEPDDPVRYEIDRLA